MRHLYLFLLLLLTNCSTLPVESGSNDEEQPVFLAGLLLDSNVKSPQNIFIHPVEAELTKQNVKFTSGDHVFRMTHIYCLERDYDKAVNVLKGMDPSLERLVVYRSDLNEAFNNKAE